jgi:hypothetical protein
MKSSQLLPIATAAIGFSVAWLAKPSTITSISSTTTVQQDAPTKNSRTSTSTRDSAVTNKRPVEVRAGDFPLAEQAENGPKTSEEAKMQRLAEALGLSFDQQGSIIQLVGDEQATTDMNVSALEDLATRGKAVEEGLRKILTPEQFEKFQEIQLRARENRSELRAQRMLADTIEYIDLSPDQRDEVMGRLRQKAKADLQSIPAAASLLYNKSILPGVGTELTPEGALLIQEMGEKLYEGTPDEMQARVLNRHKQELEEVLKCFDGVLTPAQMGQYYATLAEKKQTMDRVRASGSQRTAPKTSIEPPPPSVTIIDESDDIDDYDDE